MRRKKRTRPLTPWVAAVIAFAVAMWLLLANVVFVVRDVQVVGAGEVPEADVRHLSGIRLGTRLSAVNAEEVHKSVESDGRVAFVSLKRSYPSRVVLTVRPRSMDALILQGGKILALDSDAYVVQVAEQLPDGHVPYVSGIKAMYYTLGRQLDTSDGRCYAMKAVLEALKRQNATAYVSELNVSNTGDLRIITRTGMTVLLGDSENMDNKVAWMTGALSDLEARGETAGTLDVSSGNKADYRPQAPNPDEAEAEEEDAGADATATVDGAAENSAEAQPEVAEVPVS